MPELDNRTITYIVAAVIGIGLWAVIRYFRNRQFENVSGQLEQEASSRGWRVQSSGGSGTQTRVIEGDTDGITWKIESIDEPASGTRYGRGYRSGGKSHTLWRTQSASLQGEMILLFGDYVRRTRKDIAKRMLPGIVEPALDSDKSAMEMFKQTHMVESGSDALRKRFTLMASNDSGLERFMSAGAEMALLSWPGKAQLNVAALYPKGLTIMLSGTPGDAAQVAALVDLGVALAKAAGGR